MVASALAQEGVSRVFSYISTRIDENASRAHDLARLEMALSRLEFCLERIREMPITYVSLIRRWNLLRCAYNDGVHMLNKHKLQALEGEAETGKVVARSSSYLQQIVSGAKLSFSSLLGLKMEQHMSSSVAQKFEWYADCAEKFVTDVESGSPLRHDTFFPYPFVRKLLKGKTLRYERIQGRQLLTFQISPFILEGRGVEACLWCDYFDPERLDKSFTLNLCLRLSESIDIVGTAIDCLPSSASLHNLAAQDAIMGEFTLLCNLHDISSSYCYAHVSPKRHDLFSRVCRLDPLCCQANGHVKSTISSELQNFKEQTIFYEFSSYITSPMYSLPSASDEAGRNVMTDQPPLKLAVAFAPHCSFGDSSVTETMGGKEERHPFDNIQQTVDMVRSRSVECLINQPERTEYSVYWNSRHGWARFAAEKTCTDTAAMQARGRNNTARTAGKRKRP